MLFAQGPGAFPAPAAHPRLVITPSDWSHLKAKASENPAWFAPTKRLAYSMAQRAITPGGAVGRKSSHEFREEITTLAFVYRLSGDRTFLEAAAKRMESACALRTWKGPEFLDTANMLYGVAFGYDWLREFMAEDQAASVRKAIVRAGLSAVAEAYEKPDWWVDSSINWNLVGNGGAILLALAVLGEVPEAPAILRAALTHLEPALAAFGTDGGWAEGSEYLIYSLIFLAPTLRAYETALGTECGLWNRFPGIRRAGYFFVQARGPTDLPFNFSDCQEQSWAKSAGELFSISRLGGDPLVWDWSQRHSDESWRTLFYGSQNPPEKGGPPALDATFRRVEIATLRSAWGDSNAWYVGFKGGEGPAAVRHAHFDRGSFVLDYAGVRWADDPGPDYYTLPGWWDLENRYYRKRAEGHNTVVINPAEGPGQNAGGFCPIIRFESRSDGAHAVVDLTAAYEPAVDRFRRGIRLGAGRRGVVIRDEMQAPSPVDLLWLFHTRAKGKLAEDGRSVELAREGKTLRLDLLEPASARFQIAKAAPGPKSPRPIGQNIPTDRSTVSVRLAGVQKASLMILISDPATLVPELTQTGALDLWATP